MIATAPGYAVRHGRCLCSHNLSTPPSKRFATPIRAQTQAACLLAMLLLSHLRGIPDTSSAVAYGHFPVASHEQGISQPQKTWIISTEVRRCTAAKIHANFFSPHKKTTVPITNVTRQIVHLADCLSGLTWGAFHNGLSSPMLCHRLVQQ